MRYESRSVNAARWLSSFWQRSKRRGGQRPRSVPLRLEALEDRLTPTGPTLTTLASFDFSEGGENHISIIDNSGNLYGTTVGPYNAGTIFELAPGSGTIKTLASFNGSNGYSPNGVIMDSSGNLYGTTSLGGANNGGTIFELAHGSSTITRLASFGPVGGFLTGDGPTGDLIMDGSGNLYGTAESGGPSGLGTIFELAKGSGTITDLAYFNGTNGSLPNSLVMDSSGNLYGTAYYGGPAYDGTYDSGDGTIFELAKGSNTLTTLASFNGANGGNPTGNLVVDGSGNLYGATEFGGASGGGSVFELAHGSSTIKTLANFNGANGSFPYGGVITDSNGNLYGTTYSGTTNDIYGTVFELAKGTSTIKTLASFSFNGTSGYGPITGLTLDSSGNLYGTNYQGGASNSGAIFEVQGAVPHSSQLTVTSAQDPATQTLGTLRFAIGQANADAAKGYSDVITFNTSAMGSQTITLTQGALELTAGSGSISINGGGHITISGNNQSQIFQVDAGATANLSGLTLAYGVASNGGAVANAGNLTISSSTLSNNKATGDGGAIYNSGNLKISNSTVSNDTASYDGGSIATYGTLNVSNTTFSYDSASGQGGAIVTGYNTTTTISGCSFLNNTGLDGGAIHNDTTLTVTNSKFSGNSTLSGDGGAIINYGTATISGSTLINNISEALANNTGTSNGGGISNYGNLTLSSSTLTNNGAYNNGGGIYNAAGLTLATDTLSGNGAFIGMGGGIDNAGTLKVSNSTLSGNYTEASTAGGGGIWNEATGTATVLSSTLANNIAWGHDGSGGGMYNDGTFTLTNSTLSGNEAYINGPVGYGQGGGIYNDGTLTASYATISKNLAPDGGGVYSSGTLSLVNSIVAGNSATTMVDIDGSVTTTSAHNLIGNGTGLSGISNGDANHNQVGTSIHPINPLLAALGSYGGPTQTMPLLAGSPALGAGVAVAGITTDQRGTSRPSTPDIGAYQSQAAATFAVQVPAKVYAGTGFSVTVTAKDKYGYTVMEYNGTMTLTSSDGQSVTPATITLKNGTGAATITLNVADTVTLTAAAGAVKGISSKIVVISDWFSQNMSDPALAALARTDFTRDKAITYSDMLGLFAKAESEGSTLTSAALQSLQALVNGATTLNMPGYVQNLAYKTVFGDPANATYLGTTLGTLSATHALQVGTSAVVLKDLVNKWFLGFDHPTADVAYQNVTNVPLFANGASYWDVRQYQLGDCWLLASLSDVAFRNPSLIQSMFISDGTAQENGQTVGVWTVRFYDNGKPQYVTVDSELPGGGTYYDLITHYDPSTNGTYSSETELWVALAEKAYAQLDASGWDGRDGVNWYDNPAVQPPGQSTGLNLGWFGSAVQVITGQTGYLGQTLNFTNMVNAWNAGDYMALNSKTFATELDGNGVVSNHVYDIIGYNATTQQFELFNPWGINNGYPGAWGTAWLSWSQIQQSFWDWDYAM